MRFIKKHWLFVAFIVFLLVVGIPAIINWLFKIQPSIEFFSAEWEAGDVLTFYGSLLAAIATIFGVFLTVRYAQENYRADERNKQLPFLALTYMRKKSKFYFFDTGLKEQPPENVDDPNDYYLEYRLKNVYIVITSSGIEYKSKLSPDQYNILKRCGQMWEEKDGRLSQSVRSYISLPFELDNVGNGAAIELKVSLYKKDDLVKKAVSIDTLRVKESFYVHIFSEVETDNILGDYVLAFRYKDILSNTYSQSFPMVFLRKGQNIVEQVGFSGKQIREIEEL